jgi:peptide/nickel transport system ATP-binding protein
MSDDRRPLVELAHVSVTYATRRGLFARGSVRALDDVSLAVPEGSTVALVGESGSGKSTLGRVTLRLVDPSAGVVRFAGEDLHAMSASRLRAFRREAGIVFQDPFSSLNPSMRVEDLVAEPLIIDGVTSASERRARVYRALDAVDLAPAARFAIKYPTTLSGGQRQRVGIARALVRDPRYIVADEPVSMIDASSRIAILDLLRTLQRDRGVTFLSITHDLASARHFSDRIAVMYLGQIVEEAPAATLIDRPLHPYTQALIAAVPEPDPANRKRHRAVATGDPLSSGAQITGCPFAPRCPVRIAGTCETVRPPLVAIAPDRRVACHLHPAPR